MATGKIISAVLAGVLLMSGCAATAGNQKLGSMEKSQLNAGIVKGKSTKQDVEALLGQTDKVTTTKDGGEIWTYSFARSSLKPAAYIPLVNLFYTGTNDTTKVVVAEFDANGVVKDIIAKESESETKRGLFQ
ncbi:MAG TPA: hypothetical protein PLM93_11880 [Sulfuricurvum sp.]|nr:MAG: hypothetical protein B7Y30_11095 [Campylobacterales bacterium 16-40-21]OZA02041.1 MAG: hypothetical protein B7X89_10990 [Sulfuricurvum sp. 17-40-25]HQS67875.1 hypothetical protein [Sulfuricurvum sp.]HQT37275.1 hypothetical protein [Sulfuricurvum sp.]